MGAVVLICVFVVILPIAVYIIIKLGQGKPIPQNAGDTILNFTTDSLPNICSSTEEPYNDELFIMNYIERMKLNQDSCDVHLVHPVWSVRAHKIILAAHSETFERLLTNVSEFQIPNQDFQSFPALLEFIYDRKVPKANFIDLKNLLFVAERYQVNTLKCLLEKQLQSNLNVSNVGNLLTASIVANATYLTIAASQFLMDNLTPVSKTDTWKKVSADNPSIYQTAVETTAAHPKNVTNCHIECTSDGFASATIINRLKRFFITERFANAEIVLPNRRTFKVNRAILVEQSDVWRGKFYVNEPATSIALPFYTDSYTMKEFLIYMYSGWVAQLHTITNNLLLIANEYEMHPLKNATETIISRRLNVSNFVEYLAIAEQAQSQRLIKEFREYFFDHRKEVMNSDGWIKMKETQPELLAKVLLEL